MSYRVGFVCSGGGHLAQLVWLREWWAAHERFWVTFDSPEAGEWLAGERVHHAAGPTNRSVVNAVRNTGRAWTILRDERPDVLISNGAGIAAPFFAVGNLLGVPLVYIEVYDRVEAPSLTARLVRPLVDRMVLQWEEQRAFFPEGVVLGPVR